jgi:DNA mismatch repair protein MutL
MERTLAPGPVSLPGPRTFRFQDLTVLGTLAQTYILAQGPDGLILIDQHAAHERVLYEALKARGPGAAAQTLLFPRVVEVNPGQADWVNKHLDLLAQAGLTLEPFGGASFLITAVPAALAHADLEAVVAEAVEALAPSKSFTRPQEVREAALQIMACRGAVKAGEVLAPEAIAALLVQLDEIAVSSHCPHGRPLWRLMSYDDIRQTPLKQENGGPKAYGAISQSHLPSSFSRRAHNWRRRCMDLTPPPAGNPEQPAERNAADRWPAFESLT